MEILVNTKMSRKGIATGFGSVFRTQREEALDGKPTIPAKTVASSKIRLNNELTEFSSER